jgi:hypothetical protein
MKWGRSLTPPIARHAELIVLWMVTTMVQMFGAPHPAGKCLDDSATSSASFCFTLFGILACSLRFDSMPEWPE